MRLARGEQVQVELENCSDPYAKGMVIQLK